MKAAVVRNKGDLRIEDVPKPEVPKGSVRVRVQACAICGTDLRIYRRGDHRAEYPVILGHEIAGVVDAIDAGITGIQPGQRVCVAPGHGCGGCRMCRRGYPNVCTSPCPSLGYRVNGGFAEYMAVPENIFRLGFVNLIPDNLSFEQASMSEIIACCLNAQKNSPVREGDVVLVLGSGPAGIVHSQLARAQGAKKVIVSQRTRERLEMAAARFDIDRIVASSEEDLGTVVAEETGGEGVDVVYVCAPSGQAQELATRLVAPRGRINFFGGLPKSDSRIRLDSNVLHYKEVFIAGASSSLPEDNLEALRLLAKKTIDPDRLITHRLPLESIHEAFNIVESRQGIKVVVKP